MNIHEYQAKALLRSYGIPVSDGRVVLKAEEAKTAAGELDGPLWVVKAQIHAGGRGKGHFKEAEAGEKGGVRLARSVAEAAEFARLGPDPALLEQLAKVTGGELLTLASLDRLPGLLNQLNLPVVEVKQRPLWHTPWLFLLALGCFLGEWGLRRRRGTI